MISTLLLLLHACALTPNPPSDPGSGETVATLPPPLGGDPTGLEPQDTAGSSPTRPPELPTVDGGPFPLCINEFMPDARFSFVDDDGVPSDWIELHNPTEADVSLGGWTISDDPSEPEKHPLDPALLVEAGGYLVLWADGRPELGTVHLGFALSDQGEAVALYSPVGDGSVVWYPETSADLAMARVTDCCTVEDGDTGADAASCFEYRFAGSPGTTNGS